MNSKNNKNHKKIEHGDFWAYFTLKKIKISELCNKQWIYNHSITPVISLQIGLCCITSQQHASPHVWGDLIWHYTRSTEANYWNKCTHSPLPCWNLHSDMSSSRNYPAHGTAEAERLFSHSLTTWRNMNIRDHIISYCGQAVEDLLPYPQIAGAKQFFVAISAVLNTALLHQFSFLSLVLKSQELHKTSNTNIVMILK